MKDDGRGALRPPATRVGVGVVMSDVQIDGQLKFRQIAPECGPARRVLGRPHADARWLHHPHTRGASGRRSPPRTTYLAGYSVTRTSTSSSVAPVHALQIELTFLASDSTAPSLRPSRMWQKISVSEVGSPER